MGSKVLARLRLEVGELLEEITIYTSAQDLDRMQMIDVDEGDQGLGYPGPLCSALRIGTTTKRSLTLGRVMEMEETSPNEGRHSCWNGAVWDEVEQCGCNGLVDMRHIRFFTVRQGQLHIIGWQPVPWPLIIDNKLAPKRLTALLLEAGHHVHAMIFKYHDDSLRGWALDDEGADHPLHGQAFA